MDLDAKKFEKQLRRAAGEAVANGQIDVPCPGRGTENAVSVRDIAQEATFTWAGCGEEVQLKDEGGEFAKIIRGS